MFEIFDSAMATLLKIANREVFGCTVGEKLVRLILDHSIEVVNMLHGLASASESLSGISQRAISSISQG